MICPKCHFEQADGLQECVRCGVIFTKFRDRRQGENVQGLPCGSVTSPECCDGEADADGAFKQFLLPESVDPNPLIVGCKAILFLLLAIWSTSFLFASIESNVVGHSFMHMVNLPFHEAGHIVFSFFGSLIKALGGTLSQLLMPAVCLCVLLLRTRDAFGAAVALWWLAESFMDIAPYINDSRSLNLMLLGGVTGKDVPDYHDWEFILKKLGLLQMDHMLAYMAQGTGIVLMVTALVWAAANVWHEFNACRCIPESMESD